MALAARAAEGAPFWGAIHLHLHPGLLERKTQKRLFKQGVFKQGRTLAALPATPSQTNLEVPGLPFERRGAFNKGYELPRLEG